VSPVPTEEMLRKRAAAIGVPAERRDDLAEALSQRLASLEVVPAEMLGQIAPTVTFVPSVDGRRDSDF
jgi:hypothetical protein